MKSPEAPSARRRAFATLVPWLDRQQVVFPHKLRDPFVVDQEATPAEFRRDAPVAVPTPMCDGDPLNSRPHSHLFFLGLVYLQRPVESACRLNHTDWERFRLTESLDSI